MLIIIVFVSCVTVSSSNQSFGNVLNATIVLSQGTIIGLKVFPESSRIPVYTYLGIPYAKPPIDELRFAAPLSSPAWNRTLFARNFKPICPQIENSSYEGTVVESQFRTLETSEDCLYLNIWIPETALQYGGFPVLVMITGEEMAFDWNANRISGLDIATDGVIVVTVQYRSNIFGWLSLGETYSPGNLGLLDQQLALVWIKDNIHNFGGDTNRITLLGHGSSGGPNVMIHLVSPKAKGLFTRAIIMSGTIFSPYTNINKNNQNSLAIVEKLACNYDTGRKVLKCLQEKSIFDLLKAYDLIHRNANSTMNLGPVVDNYLPSSKQYIPRDPRMLFEAKAFTSSNIPIIYGITSNEGAFLHKEWIDLARQGYDTLQNYVKQTLIPDIIEHYHLKGIGQDQIQEIINWKFFNQIAHSPAHLLRAIIKIVSETRYEIPFYRTLRAHKQPATFSVINVTGNDKADPTNNEPGANGSQATSGLLYAYLFHHPNSMDMRGRINLFGGASHSSDLPVLMGPSLYKEIGRRRLSQIEEKLCKRLRALFTDFVKGGHPTPGRQFDSWEPYTNELKYIKLISAKTESILQSDCTSLDITFKDNLQEIRKILLSLKSPRINNVNTQQNPYDFAPNEQANQDILRPSKSSVVIDAWQDTEYLCYLKNVESFWEELLPKLYKIVNEANQRMVPNHCIDYTQKEEQDIFREMVIGSKYKHAFFSMLTLVCMLLAVLGICVYVLKRNYNVGISSIL